MPSLNAKSHPEMEWLNHQPLLKHLWLEQDKPLRGENSVMCFMEETHGFFAT